MGIICDSNAFSLSDGSIQVRSAAGTVSAVSQSFTGVAGVLSSVFFKLRKSGSPTGNIIAKIYAHSGTFGTNSVPTGAALASSNTIDVSTLQTSDTIVGFNFSDANKITLVNGTKYCVVFEYLGVGSAANNTLIAEDTTAGTHGGNRATYNITTALWTASSTTDVVFSVIVDGSGDFMGFM